MHKRRQPPPDISAPRIAIASEPIPLGGPDAPTARRLLTLAALLAIAGVAALSIDVWAAEHLRLGALPEAVGKLLRLAEVFSHGGGVAMILLTVAVLDRAGRGCLLRLCCQSLGAGLISNVGKLLVARVRPYQFDHAAGVLASFTGWLPLGTSPAAWQSFPSSHTATAAGLAAGLAMLYPHGRAWFATLAVLAALQRVAARAHFVSDTLCGAAVGLAVAAALHPAVWSGRWLNHWEGGCRSTAGPGSDDAAPGAALDRAA